MVLHLIARACYQKCGKNTDKKDANRIMASFTPPVLRGLLKKPGRHPDGQAKGLYFRAVGDGKAYWVFRFRIAGREREMSLGAYPETKLDEARAKRAVLRAQVLNKSDPLAGKRGAKAVATPSTKPTFGVMADDYVATHEGGWRNPKHRWQWTQTLTSHCAPIRDMLVDEIGTDDVLAVLKPLWTRAPVTGSRLRGRIERVLNAARALGHIDKDKANPARWKAHLDELLPKPKKLARGHHAAMPYADAPEFVERLRVMNSTAALAMEFLVLTATRSGETLDAKWDEINFDTATWIIPPGRMKTNEAFSVPLSDRALGILRALEAQRGKNPFVFAGRRQRPLSNMALAMLLRRMNIDVTAHGFRTSFRTWCSDVAHAEFEVAEQCLSHRIGSAVSRAYNRTSMLERRRPLMQAWADFVTGKTSANVVPFRAAAGE
jgi:integrase